jgi:hypothetical protein
MAFSSFLNILVGVAGFLNLMKKLANKTVVIDFVKIAIAIFKSVTSLLAK